MNFEKKTIFEGVQKKLISEVAIQKTTEILQKQFSETRQISYAISAVFRPKYQKIELNWFTGKNLHIEAIINHIRRKLKRIHSRNLPSLSKSDIYGYSRTCLSRKSTPKKSEAS